MNTSWFRVHSTIIDSEKFRRASNAACGIWMKLCALACERDLENGRIARRDGSPMTLELIAHELGETTHEMRDYIDELLHVRLLERDEEGYYCIHDWREWNAPDGERRVIRRRKRAQRNEKQRNTEASSPVADSEAYDTENRNLSQHAHEADATRDAEDDVEDDVWDEDDASVVYPERKEDVTQNILHDAENTQYEARATSVPQENISSVADVISATFPPNSENTTATEQKAQTDDRKLADILARIEKLKALSAERAKLWEQELQKMNPPPPAKATHKAPSTPRECEHYIVTKYTKYGLSPPVGQKMREAIEDLQLLLEKYTFEDVDKAAEWMFSQFEGKRNFATLCYQWGDIQRAMRKRELAHT